MPASIEFSRWAAEMKPTVTIPVARADSSWYAALHVASPVRDKLASSTIAKMTDIDQE